MDDEKKYHCSACGTHFVAAEEIKKHVKEDHGKDLTDEQAEMMKEDK